MAAEAYLSGENVDLDDVISINPCYTYTWFPIRGWKPSSASETKKIIDKVKNRNGFPDLFSQLPRDLMLILAKNTAGMINLAKTSTHRYRWFQENLRESVLINKLLTHAVFGEWKAARKIWSTYPAILRRKGKVKCGEHTAYQIAWKNEEADIIAEMNALLPLEEQQQQFYEIFPDGELVKHNWDFKKGSLLLQNVFIAVTKDTLVDEFDMSLMNDETKAALQALHDYLNPEISGHCQTGLVCDVRIYQEALKYLDNAKFDFLTNWGRTTFWCIRVEEMIASLLSTGYLRAHCQGIGNIVQGGQKMNDAGCCFPKGEFSYFHCTEDMRPGFHFYVDNSGIPRTVPNVNMLDGGEDWRIYITQQKTRLEALKPPKPKPGIALRVNL